MKKLLIFIFPFSLLVARAQEEARRPLFSRLYDIQMYGGTYVTRRIDLQLNQWQTLNPDGFPQVESDKKGSWFGQNTLQARQMQMLEVQFALRKKNPLNKGLWLSGIVIGTSTGSYAGKTWSNNSGYYVLDTVSYSSGAPSQLLIGDTITTTNRQLNVSSAHIGGSIGYTTNPSRLFSFRVRAVLDISVSTQSQATYQRYTGVRQGLYSDTTDAGANLNETAAYVNTSAYSSTYSSNAVFGVGLQVPVGISWQLSSFRPILSRFSFGAQAAGGIRVISLGGGLGTYSTPTFSIGLNFAYRFKTWIPDSNNIRKIREKQRAGEG